MPRGGRCREGAAPFLSGRVAAEDVLAAKPRAQIVLLERIVQSDLAREGGGRRRLSP